MSGWRRTGVVALLCAWLVANAQTTSPPTAPVAPPPGTLPTPAELAPRPLPSGVDPMDLPARPAPPRELGKPDEDLKIDVQRYEVPDDAPAALKAHLAEITHAYVGPKRSYEELVDAASEVTRYLQSELGYYLGYAYLPEQSPKDGVIRIAILEGRLDHVELHWTDGLPVDRAVVEGYLARLKPDSILRVSDVERIVFLINDLRGITARFEVQAGSRPGTATLVVTPVADRRIGGRVDLDANGTRFLGKYRLSGLTTLNSPFGRGDGLTGDVMTSETHGLQFALLGYTTPVGSDGLKMGTSVSALHYRLDGFGYPLNGTSIATTAYALYPNIRSRNLNLFTLVSLERKDYRDVQAGISTPKDVTSLALGVSGDKRDSLLSGGVDTYDMSYAFGRVNYPDGRPTALTDAVHYGKLDFTFSRLQNLVTSRLLLYGLLRGQYALDNLDTTEQFRLGGSDGIRAYAPGEGTGDSGAYLTLELRLLPSASLLGSRAREFVFGLFYDYGHFVRRHDVGAVDESSSVSNTGSLAGAGLSLTWEGAEGYAVRGSVAAPTEGTATNDTQKRAVRLYLTLSKSFH